MPVPHKGWVYYPHPETKLGHFQAVTVIEILAPPISDIGYGDRLTVSLKSAKVEVQIPESSSPSPEGLLQRGLGTAYNRGILLTGGMR